MNKLSFSLIPAVAAATFSFAAQGITIDDFEFGSAGPNFITQGFTSTPGFDRGSELGPASSIIGGERDIYVAELPASPGGASTDVITGPVAGGLYKHGQLSGIFGYSIASWDGLDGASNIDSAVGLGGVDITTDGIDLILNIFFSDAGAEVTFFFFSSDTAWSSVSTTFGAIGIPMAFDYDLATDTTMGIAPILADGVTTPDFLPTVDALAPADFTSITAIAMLVDGSAVNGLDLSLDFSIVDTVPVPASALLLVVGAGALAQRRRRRMAMADA